MPIDLQEEEKNVYSKTYEKTNNFIFLSFAQGYRTM